MAGMDDGLIAALLAAALAAIGAPLLLRAGGWAGMLAAGVLALPILAGVAWSFPSDDDWCYGAARHGSWWAAQIGWYTGWSGRYAATAVLTAWGQAEDVWWAIRVVYPLILVAIVFAWPLALAWLLRGLLPGVPVRAALIAAALIAATALASLPSVSDGVFWLAGAVTYMGGVAVVLAMLAAWLAALTQGGIGRWLSAVILALLAPGFSEVLAALVLPAVVAAWWLHARRRSAALPALGVIILLAVGVAAAAAAPGNAQRLAALAAEGTLPVRDPLALSSAAAIAFRQLADLPWAVVLAGALTAGIGLAPWARGRWWVWLVLAALMPFVAAVPPAAAGTAPPRAANPVVVLVVGSLALAVASALRARIGPPRRLALLVVIGAGALPAMVAAPDGEGLLRLLPFAVLAVAVIASGRLHAGAVVAALLLAAAPASPHWPSAWGDLRRGPAARTAQDRQLSILAAAAPGAHVGVPLMLLPAPPRLAWHGDLRVSAGAWANQGAAAFFALAEVRGLVASGPAAGR